MPFVEVFATSVREDQKSAICTQLVSEVLEAEGAPDTEAARSISWLVWHDVSAWCVGGLSVQASEPPRYVVRVAVPAGSLDDTKRAEMVERVTKVLASVDADGDRLYQDPAAWVHITEIAEGDWGALGRVVRTPDIARYVQTGQTT
jgi:phenylpyruvate tautomerase PptA (4-oxalocrotonate tautomerase family)